MLCRLKCFVLLVLVTCGLYAFSTFLRLLKVQVQVDRSLVIRREKELNAKVESADAARNAIENTDSRTEELELQLQKCIIEKNDLEIKMEEAIQDAGQVTYLSIFVIL